MLLFMFQAQYLQLLHHFIGLIVLMVIPIISITCCRSKKDDKGGGELKASQQQSQKKLTSESKVFGQKIKSAEKKEKRGGGKKSSKPSSSSNPSKTSTFKSNFDGLNTAITLEPGAKKSSFLPLKLLKSSGKVETTAKSISKPTTKSASFSKSAMAEAPSDMKSKMPEQSKLKGGISQKRFKTIEEKIAATKRMLAYTGRKGPPSGSDMGNVDKHIEKKAEGHLAVSFSPKHVFDTPAYRYATRNPKAGQVAKLNEAGNMLFICDDVSKTKSASSSTSSKMKEAEVTKSQVASVMEDEAKKDEADVHDSKDEDDEDKEESTGD